MMPETRNPFSSARIVGKNVNPAVYHQQDAKRGEPAFIMSRGELMEFNHCPSRWIAGYQKKDTDSSEWGTLMDALLMMSERQFEEEFAVTPAMYPCESTKKYPRTEKPWNWNAAHCKEWRDEQEAAGKTVVTSTDKSLAERACSVLMSDPVIRQIFTESEKQVHVFAEYHDKDTGLVIPVKCLIDIAPPIDSEFGKALADFKTSYSAFPFIWQRSVFEHNYHVQAALYTDAYTLATGEDRTDWLHIIQENYAPWQVGKRLLSIEFLELGRLKYIAALRFYCACLAANHWPGYERDGKLNFQGFELCEPQPFMVSQ